MSEEKNTRPVVVVVAAALVRSDGRLLLAQRPHGRPMEGLWELPGGKIEPGETPEEALVREVREELYIGLDRDDLKPFAFASHGYPSFHLLMPVFMVRRWQGSVQSRENQSLAWVTRDTIDNYPAPDADYPLFEKLKDWWRTQA